MDLISKEIIPFAVTGATAMVTYATRINLLWPLAVAAILGLTGVLGISAH